MSNMRRNASMSKDHSAFCLDAKTSCLSKVLFRPVDICLKPIADFIYQKTAEIPTVKIADISYLKSALVKPATREIASWHVFAKWIRPLFHHIWVSGRPSCLWDIWWRWIQEANWHRHHEYVLNSLFEENSREVTQVPAWPASCHSPCIRI